MLTLLTLIVCLQANPDHPRLEIETYRLPNGLTVVLHPDRSVPRVAVAVAYHVGSRDERAGRTGFAHFFEHMMFRGTAQVPNFDIPLQEAGGSANAFTNEDMTVYQEVVTPEYLERALYMEANRLAFLSSALDQDKFDTEREVVKNERRQSYENVPYGLAEEAIIANLFPTGHPYSWSVIGSMADLDRATLDDLRSFFATHYHPANAALSLAGDFDPETAKTLIARYFGPIPAGPKRTRVVPPATTSASKRVVMSDIVTLPRVYWVWPTVPDEHPDAPALDLLSDVLASGDASRLERSLVREQRLASAIDASSDTREAAGLFQVTATLAEGKSLEDLEAGLASQIAKLRDDPPTETERNRVVASKQRASYERLANPLGRAITLATGAAQYGKPERYRTELERTLAVTKADLARVAKQYLTDDKLVIVIEPGAAKSPAPSAGPDESLAAEEAQPRALSGDQPDWSKMPGPSAAREFQPPSIARKALSNGLDVWFVRWDTLPIFEARLLLPAGSSSVPAEKAGLADLAATLAAMGTKTKTASELAQAIDTLGGALSTGADVDHAVMSFSGLAPNFDPILSLVTEALVEPRLDADDVARERALQLTSLKRVGDSPQSIAARVFPMLLYGSAHPYGVPTAGRIDTVESLTRDDIAAFHRDRYIPRGAKLVIAGDLDPESLWPLLERTFGGWSTDNPNPKPIEATPATDAGKFGVIYLVDKPGAPQSVIRVGRPWVDRGDPRYFAAELGNRVLGGDFLSRLNQNLRERNGYTYGAGSRLGYRQRGGTWIVATNVRTNVTGPALKEILGELALVSRAGDRPPADAEIAVNRDAEARSWLDAFGSPDGLVGLVSDLAQHDRPVDEPQHYLRALREVSNEEISAVLAELADPTMKAILIVGDRKVVEPQLREAGFDRIELLDIEGRPIAK